MSTDLLLLNEAKLAELFQMMEGDAWAAETQSALNFSYSDGLSSFQEKPVDLPCFATKCVLKVRLAFFVQTLASCAYSLSCRCI
jgi:hypothetical protein